MAWYNANWDYRVKITVQSSKVAATLTDFPVYVDLSDLPAGFFTNVDSAGDDIRVTQSDGTTECAFELVSINTGASTGGVWFMANSLNAASNTDFYIYYGNAAASAYAAGAAYGRNAVWADDQAMIHDGGGTNSVGSNNATTVSTTAGAATGKLDFATDYDGINDYGYIPFAVMDDAELSNTVSISVWVYNHNLSSDGSVIANWGPNINEFQVLLYMDTGDGADGYRGLVGEGNPGFATKATSATASNAIVNTWQHIVYTFDGATVRVYVDGSLSSASSTSAFTMDSATYDIAIASDKSTSAIRSFNGLISEIKITDRALSADWIATEYNNQDDPATFFSIGAQEAQPTSGPTAPPRIFYFG